MGQSHFPNSRLAAVKIKNIAPTHLNIRQFGGWEIEHGVGPGKMQHHIWRRPLWYSQSDCFKIKLESQHQTRKPQGARHEKITGDATRIFHSCFFLLFSFVISCGSEAKMENQISGLWHRTQGNGTVDIKLANEPKSLFIDGHSYKAVVDKTKKGSFTTLVKAEVDTGKTEVWSFRQVWNDNGSNFKLAFRHNGTMETLERAGQS